MTMKLTYKQTMGSVLIMESYKKFFTKHIECGNIAVSWLMEDLNAQVSDAQQDLNALVSDAQQDLNAQVSNAQ